MTEPDRMTPLRHRAAIQPGSASRLAISEIAGRAMLDLRIRPQDTATLDDAAAALGFALPATARGSTGQGSRQALWLSVDRWLLICPIGERDAFLGAIGAALAGRFAAVTDQSDARAVIRLAGEGVDEVLIKGAEADLGGPGPGAGTVRRMQLSGVPAIAHTVSASPDITDLYVDRSFADFAWSWLVQAARQSARVRLFASHPPPPV